MKSLLLLPLLVLGARAEPRYTELYTGYGQSGYYVYFDIGADELFSYNMDDDIESVRQTGMWMYYENDFYNIDVTGKVYYVHGIDIAVTFPTEYQNIMSSLRYAGSVDTLNADTITFYEGTAFAGWGYYTTTDDVLEWMQVAGNVSSILVTGSSPWTVYTGLNYTGSAWCLYNTHHDVGINGTTLDLGIFPSMEDIGIPDNSITSLRKGCHDPRVAKAPKLQVEGRQENGAWGRLV